jgi:uroporphyrinogen decarboxylase
MEAQPGTLTSRERLLQAFARRQPDHVPVSADISAMVPVRLAGKPFDVMFLDGLPHHGYASASVAQAYVDAIRYYGMDGWYIYGGLKEIVPPDRPRWQSQLTPLPQGGQLRSETAFTRYGILTRQSLFPTGEPPWEPEKPVKDLRQDWLKLKALMGEDEHWRWEEKFIDRERIGEWGVYSVAIGIPQDWWFFQREGGYNTLFYDFLDEEDFMQNEVFAFYTRAALARLKAVLAAQPDEVMLGGSASSLSASSPGNFRKFDLPFIQKAAQMCREAGVFSHLHVCGRSRKVVEMVAEESEVDIIEPLEEPPGGDVDIAAIKKRYGQRICLKGNLNTFEFMLRATPQEVEARARRLIDDCAPGGGFVLSTGDQCGRDTPDANLFKLVEVAQTYGKYS